MYYNRTISNNFANELKYGQFQWLIPYVKEHDDLDILTGKNDSIEFCSVYRGTSRIARIYKSVNGYSWLIDAANPYMKICPELFSVEGFNKDNLEYLRSHIAAQNQFNRYYNNHKEGYYQNLLQRKYGILAPPTSKLLIFDKEIVIGYSNQSEKKQIYGINQDRYQSVKINLKASNPKSYGQPHNNQEILGNELDLMALDKEGYIHLMEIKHSSNPSGIYMSPFQIGLYKRLFDMIDIINAVKDLIIQKQDLGLLPHDWPIPTIQKQVIPELIICEFKANSQCYPSKYNEVVKYIQNNASDIYKDVKDIVVRDEHLNHLCR